MALSPCPSTAGQQCEMARDASRSAVGASFLALYPRPTSALADRSHSHGHFSILSDQAGLTAEGQMFSHVEVGLGPGCTVPVAVFSLVPLGDVLPCGLVADVFLCLSHLVSRLLLFGNTLVPWLFLANLGQGSI
jgi:hypothetical protein